MPNLYIQHFIHKFALVRLSKSRALCYTELCRSELFFCDCPESMNVKIVKNIFLHEVDFSLTIISIGVWNGNSYFYAYPLIITYHLSITNIIRTKARNLTFKKNNCNTSCIII